MSRTDAGNETSTGDYFGGEWVDLETTSNRGGWLVTYADMMTIILTFMILLLSVSTIAQTKFDLLVEAMTGRKVGNLHKVKKKIDRVVDKASLGGQVTTSIGEDGMKVQFSNALLFESGEAELTDEALEVFEPIADHLNTRLNPEYGVTVEGYSDDVPIENGRFESNWELSAKRAINVRERLASDGFDRRRISVHAFADTRSATDVDLHDERERDELSEERLEEVRAKNRRVVLRIHRLDDDVLRDILEERESVDAPNGDESSAESGADAPSTSSDGAPSDAESSGDDQNGIRILNQQRDASSAGSEGR